MAMLISNHQIGISSNLVIPVERELEFPLVPYWRHECKRYSVTFESYDGKLYIEKQITKEGEELISTVLDADSGEVVKETVYRFDTEFAIIRHFSDRLACVSTLGDEGSFIWYEDGLEKWRTSDDIYQPNLIYDELIVSGKGNLSVVDTMTGALKRQVEGDQIGRLEIFDNNIKVLYKSANLLACRDFRTFELLWEIDLQQFAPDEKEIHIRYRIADGFIYCQCSDKMFCLEAQTGRLLWITECAGGRLMHVKDRKIYFSGPWDITCIDGATGQTIYKTHYKKDRPDWRNGMKCGLLHCSGLVVGKYLLTNEHEWLLSVADLDTGEVIWEVPKKGHFEGGMMFLNGKLYISSYPHLWCFGPKEGQPAEARKKRLGNNLKWEDLRGLPNPT